MRRILMLMLMLVVAGCGGGSKSSDSGGSTVNLAGSKLGQILVDGKGRTLYLFEADKSGKSACSGACAGTWPPLTATSPSAGSGLEDGALATTKRADGREQVTYHGHPLYTYAADGSSAGSTKGEGLNTFGGKWYVVDGTGKAVEPAGTGNEMGGGQSGYGY
jgi:predicted lipoprotein with Yx(FWY)xxD motif